MRRPPLPSDVIVQPGLDADDLTDRFEVFEALHHGLRIASPMSSPDLDAVVDLLDPKPNDSALDLACGSGELLCRLAERTGGCGLGIDLSPWMIRAAHARAAELGVPSVEWVLGEAKTWAADPADLVTCLGASWVWHGLPGTVRAVAERTRVGGRVAVGDMRRADHVSADSLRTSHGPVPGADEIDAIFDAHGLEVLGRVTTSPAAWADYRTRTRAAFDRWAVSSGSARVEEYRGVLEDWDADQIRDQDVLVWSVWVGRRRG